VQWQRRDRTVHRPCGPGGGLSGEGRHGDEQNGRTRQGEALVVEAMHFETPFAWKNNTVIGENDGAGKT
jgi:hypothetical protein